MTPGIEEYLEALFHLIEEGGPVKPKEMADRLEVSQASAAEMTKRLVAEDLVTYVPYQGVEFTDTGRRAANSLVRRHRLSERFLSDILGLPWEDVHDEACKFEHVISDHVEDHLAEALGHPETCPHGNPIPGAAKRRPRLVKLAELRPGQSGVIAKITEERPKFLKYLASLGLLPQVPVCVEEVAPFEGPILARVGSASYALGREVAGQIWVEKASVEKGRSEKHPAARSRTGRARLAPDQTKKDRAADKTRAGRSRG